MTALSWVNSTPSEGFAGRRCRTRLTRAAEIVGGRDAEEGEA